MHQGTQLIKNMWTRILLQRVKGSLKRREPQRQDDASACLLQDDDPANKSAANFERRSVIRKESWKNRGAISLRPIGTYRTR
jgi:hypothetical protein